MLLLYNCLGFCVILSKYNWGYCDVYHVFRGLLPLGGVRRVRDRVLGRSGSPVKRTVQRCCRGKQTNELHIFSSRFSRSRVPISALFEACSRVPSLRHETLRLYQKQILSIKSNTNYRDLVLRREKTSIATVSVSPLSIGIVARHNIGRIHRTSLVSRTFIKDFSAVLVLVGNSNVVKHLRHVPLFFQQVGRLLTPKNYILVSSDSLECIFRSRSNILSVSLGTNCCNRISFQVRCGRVGKRPFS